MSHFRTLLFGGVVASVVSASLPAAESSDTKALQAQIEALARKVEQLEAKLQAASTAAPAQSVPVDALDQKVRVIERKLEIADEDAQKAKKEAPVISASDKGFSITSPDKNFQIKLRGLIHADTRYYLDDNNAANIDDGFIARRVRPIVEGTVFEKYDFRITPDFGGGRTIVQDAYLDARFQPWAKLRFGKFKPPVGLERLAGSTDLKFIERGLPTSLVPNRDLGVQLHGDVLDGRLNYAVGIFNGVPDGQSSDQLTTADRDVHDSKDFAGRLFALPFLTSDIFVLQGLGFGFAATSATETGDAAGTLLAGYSTVGQNSFFAYRGNSTVTPTAAAAPVTLTDGTFAAGERMRLAPQAYYFYGPFGLLGEYVESSQDVRRNVQATAAATGRVTTTTPRSGELTNTAWQIQASYLLTGEDNSYKTIKPAAPFKLGDQGWGAFELVARYGELDVDDDAFTGGASSFANPVSAASEAEAWGIGVNWYVNNFVKFAVNYDQTTFEGGGGGTAAAPVDRADEHALFGRAQIAF